MVMADPRYELPRDLESKIPTRPLSKAELNLLGYGEHSLNPQWPNNAKICLSFLLNYEEGGEGTVLNGDAHSEPYLWGKGASSTFITGARHISSESEYEYGSRSGAWRILRLFKEMRWHFTNWAVAEGRAIGYSV
jgi:peptidoglycan/xylan/chitin deacetylase (PgdA/CDA1 family)